VKNLIGSEFLSVALSDHIFVIYISFILFFLSMIKAIAYTDSFTEALRFFTYIFFLSYGVKPGHKLDQNIYIWHLAIIIEGKCNSSCVVI